MVTYINIDGRRVARSNYILGTSARPPQDGRGQGKGVQGGRRQNQNQRPCKSGPGKSQGGARGKGRNR